MTAHQRATLERLIREHTDAATECNRQGLTVIAQVHLETAETLAEMIVEESI